MDSQQDMQKFINAAAEYLRHHSESYASEIQRHLQLIGSTSNSDSFDPTSPIAIKFYASLHELLSASDSRSMLVWTAISVLQKACTNESAKRSLVHTFKFVPVLTKFLDVEHLNDKQTKLFNVLRELTYGVKIAWEEAHLPHLVSILIQIVFSDNNELKPLALEVIVNLCYDNLPVLYVLMGKVDLTKFIQCITKIKNDTPLIGMHVCKMLIIIEQVKGSLPDRDILNFVSVIFDSATKAFQERDYNLLKKIVSYFVDIKESHHFRSVAPRYDKCHEDTQRLIQMAAQENAGDNFCKCLPLVLEFLHAAFFMNCQKNTLLLSLLNLAVDNLENEAATLSCLKIIRLVAESEAIETSQNGQGSVLKKLSESLPLFVGLLDNLDSDSIRITEKKKRVTSLATLLAVMSGNSELRKLILQSLSCESIKGIFQGAFKFHNSDPHVFHSDNGELCVKLLSLVAKLANYKADWMSFASELLSNKHILMELAVTFENGDKDIKYEVLRLAGNNSWGRDSLVTLCDMMTSLKMSGVVEKSPQSSPQEWSPREAMPFYTRDQEVRLNGLLEKIEKAVEEGKVSEVTASSLMELYDFKLGAMCHSERRIQTALQASDTRCTTLNHQVVQLRSEVLRLHELLFSYQLSIEGAKREKNSLIEKQKILKEHGVAEKAQLTRQINDLKNQIQQLEKSLSAKDAEMKTRLNEHDLAMQKVRAEGEARANNLGLEIQELQCALAESMKINQQKEIEIAECNKQIDDLERIREMVVNVAAKKDKKGGY